MATKKYLVSVPEEEGKWLDNHPEINKSGIFQKVVKSMMTNGTAILNDDLIGMAPTKVDSEINQ